jgi:hypothetical protein
MNENMQNEDIETGVVILGAFLAVYFICFIIWIV